MAGANSSAGPSFGLLLLRLGAGGLLLYGHGWGKLMHFSQRAPHFSDPLGVGSPRSLMLAIFAEVVCSILVMLGFATRFACVPIIIMLLVAAFMVNAGAPWDEKELALIYLVPFACLLFTGAGQYALDTKFGPKVSFKGGK